MEWEGASVAEGAAFEREHEVAVVGAGPAGSAVATFLARWGHQVLLVDRARFPRPKPCAEYLSPGAVALLEDLGALEGVAASTFRRLRGMEMVSPRGFAHLLEYRANGGQHLGMAMSRSCLDASLLGAARSAGADVLESFRVLDVVRVDGAVRGLVGTHADGPVRRLGARLVIGADGLHSAMVQRLGLRRSVRWPRRLGLVTHLEGVPWQENYGQMHVGPHGYVGIAPVDDRLVSLGMVLRLPREPVGSPTAALFRGLADYPSLAHHLADARPVEPVRGMGPLAHAVRAVAGPGFALVGDAAGFLDPFTGEGLYRALRGAQTLAREAHTALDRPGSIVDVSASYAAARRAAFGAKERLTWLVQVFVHTPALMDYAVQRLARRPALAQRLANVLGDLEPADPTLAPPYLWSLLRP